MGPLLNEAGAARDARRRSQVSAISAREEQVAALVAEGLSNRQIATRLHLSERTVENHVTHILTKLGFESRARIAAWYAAPTRRLGSALIDATVPVDVSRHQSADHELRS
jgi:DNA-binding NarL/FixJ family response regulator